MLAAGLSSRPLRQDAPRVRICRIGLQSLHRQLGLELELELELELTQNLQLQLQGYG
ncbi:MAG: hypothetical protein ACI93R_002416 [Flavobacteriales bacterium]|jgi:hypothetical protein